MSLFNTSLSWVLEHEGGYSDHPRDPGGATMRGVTQRTYDAYRASMGLPQKHVRHISDQEIHDIYRRQYWDQVRGDDLPRGLNYCLFDYAVNSGPSRAVKELQRALGFKGGAVDGVLGIHTLGAVKRHANDVAGLILEICDRRMRFLRGLRHWGTFGRGWTRRVVGNEAGYQHSDIGVLDRSMRLALQEPAPDIPRPVSTDVEQDGANAKASPDNVSLTKVVKEAALDKKAVGGALTAIGSSVATSLTEPPFSYAAAFCVGVIVLAFVFLFIREELQDDTR